MIILSEVFLSHMCLFYHPQHLFSVEAHGDCFLWNHHQVAFALKSTASMLSNCSPCMGSANRGNSQRQHGGSSYNTTGLACNTTGLACTTTTCQAEAWGNRTLESKAIHSALLRCFLRNWVLMWASGQTIKMHWNELLKHQPFQVDLDESMWVYK